MQFYLLQERVQSHYNEKKEHFLTSICVLLKKLSFSIKIVFTEYGKSNFEKPHFVEFRYTDERILTSCSNTKTIVFGLFLLK